MTPVKWILTYWMYTSWSVYILYTGWKYWEIVHNYYLLNEHEMSNMNYFQLSDIYNYVINNYTNKWMELPGLQLTHVLIFCEKVFFEK